MSEGYVSIGTCPYCGVPAAIPRQLYGVVVPLAGYICARCTVETPLTREKGKKRRMGEDEVSR